MSTSNGKHCPVCDGCPDPDHCYDCGDQFLDHNVKPDPESCSKCKCAAYVDAPVDMLCDHHDEELCVEHGSAYDWDGGE